MRLVANLLNNRQVPWSDKIIQVVIELIVHLSVGKVLVTGWLGYRLGDIMTGGVQMMWSPIVVVVTVVAKLH